jgi:cystathionine beta-synthase
MMKIANQFTDNDVVVVLLPDSGERYLSKIYNDDWMRENGFLIPERITVRYLLQAKGKKPRDILSVNPATPVRKALDLFKENDISQLPVLEGGNSVGALHDHEVMAAILEQPALVDGPVTKVMSPSFPSADIDALIGDVIHLMTSKRNSAVLVEDSKSIAGILTRYDVIEFLGKE